MSLVEPGRLVDTLLTFFQDEKPVYDTIISNYLGQRKFLTLFKGIRAHIPESSLPSIEVGPVSDNLEWHAVRVQQDNLSLEVHITTSNMDPATAIDLEGKLVAITTRILTVPPHLRAQIQGTNTWLYDSPLPSVQYGATAAKGNMRVAKISWQGKALEFLSDQLFPPSMQGGGLWVGI